MSFRDNFFVKNAGYGISISAYQLINLSGTGSVADNGKGGVYVSGETIWQSGTWKKHDEPYIVDGILDISGFNGVEINIHPGTEFHFLPGAYIEVGKENPGALIASGSDNLPIIFDSYDQDEYWGADEDGITGGIRIGKNADVKTELKYCKVDNATSGVYVDASVKVENCSFKNNREYGIVIDKNANPELISGNTYSNNGKDSLLIIQ
jgi:hypothetical protein